MTIEPNFEAMFRSMLAEAKNQSEAVSLFAEFRHFEEQRASLLREVLRFLAPLNVAAMSITNVLAIEAFRNLLADMVVGIDKEASRLEERVAARAAALVPEEKP